MVCGCWWRFGGRCRCPEVEYFREDHIHSGFAETGWYGTFVPPILQVRLILLQLHFNSVLDLIDDGTLRQRLIQ